MRLTIPVILALVGLAACGSQPEGTASAKKSTTTTPAVEPAPAAPTPSPSPEVARQPEPPLPAPTTKEEAVSVPTRPPAPESSIPAGFREVFPHVRVDLKAKEVQFDGIVPIDAHDERSPWVYLEVVACTPDTKEHEALVMTEAKASHVHAALLLIGLQPGSPGRWTFENKELKPVVPKGDEVRVTLSYRGPDGAKKSFTLQQMVVNAQNGRHFGDGTPGKWVFAGSQIVTRMGKDVYDADGAGTLLGLTTFGSETIAWSELISPDAATEEPVWVADKETTPPVGTPITVTIRPAK